MFSKFSVKKPFTVFVAVIIIIILGVVSFTKMSIDLLPNMNMPYAIVMSTYPGSTAEEIELSVTSLLEQAMASINNVKSQQSISNDNYCIVVMEFNQTTNMDSAMVEIAGVIDQVSSTLPDGASTPTAMRINPSMLPTMMFAVSAEGMSQQEASEFVNKKLASEFESIPGVASISKMGILENMIHIELSENKINSIKQELEDNIQKEIDKALEEGTETFTQSQKEAMDLTTAAYQMQAKAEQAKNEITTVTLKTVLNEFQTLLKERIEEIKSEIENNEIETPESLKDALESLELLYASLNSGDISSIQAILSTLIMNSNPDTIITDVGNAIDTYINGFIVEIDIKKEVEDLLAKSMQNAQSSKAVKNAIANYASLYSKYIQLNEQANVAKTSLLIAASNAQMQAGGVDTSGQSFDITKDTVTQLLTAQNFDMPAGSINDGDESFVIRTGNKVKSFEELKKLPLMEIPTIGTIYLSDVANLTQLDNSESIYAKVNGNNAIALTVTKQPEYSTADVSKAIYSKMDELKGNKESLNFSVIMDQGEYVDLMINTIIQNLIIGGILAIIVLFIFLRSLRPTIVVGTSIVICVITTFVLMYFSGISLNIISMSGIALSVGMLVDNSIVVIENIFRLRSEGILIKNASIEGAKQMSGAIVASTLTTIVVFVPIIFTEGITRQLFEDMALTIGYALLSSLFVALTIVPAASSLLLKKVPVNKKTLFDKITNVYVSFLDKTLHFKWATISVVIVLLIVSVVAAMSSGTQLFPAMDQGSISLNVNLPVDYTDKEQAQALDDLYDVIKNTPNVKTVGIMKSDSNNSVMMMGSAGSISGYILLDEDRKVSTDTVVTQIRSKVDSLDFEVDVVSDSMDMSALSGSSVGIHVFGKELDDIRSTALEVAKIVEETAGTMDVDNGLGKPTKEIRINVDKDKAAKYNLPVASVYMCIAGKMKSATSVTEITDNNIDYSVYVYDDRDTGLKVEDLKNIVVATTEDGEEVKVSDVATITNEEGFSSISRFEGERLVSVSASIQTGYNVGKVNEAIEKKLANYTPKSGCYIEISGESASIDSSFKDLILMIVLAIVFIYLVMVAQFQSLLSPFIIMFTIPLAFTGGFLGLFVCQIPMSIVSMIGLVVLVGVVVNNGIVYVSCVNDFYYDKGYSLRESLLETARIRIRPIIMTSLTTIIALLISAFDTSAGAAMMRPVSITVVGGLIYSTILTLFFVPAMYALFHRKEYRVKKENEEEIVTE